MGRLTVTRFMREQWTSVSPSTHNAEGKSIVLTGATAGLGLEAAKILNQKSPERLILTARNKSRVSETKRGWDSGSAEWMTLDMASFKSIKAFKNDLGDQNLSCLISNAGLSTRKYVPTEDGWETTLQVNYLSHALLSILLLPNLIKSASQDSPGRLLLVSSDGHYQVSSLDDISNATNILEKCNDVKYCNSSVMADRYKFSKLFLLGFCKELTSRLAPQTPIVVSSINPGLCLSRITRESEARFPGSLVVPAFRSLIARSTLTGAHTLVNPAVDPSPERFHGCYLTNGEPIEESDLLLGAKGKEFSSKLWIETIDVLQKVDPRVKEILADYTVSV